MTQRHILVFQLRHSTLNMVSPITIAADEINCLILAYFQDSGLQHSAFTLRMETRLDHSHHIKKPVPRGELVELLSKALFYSEVEAHWRSDSLATNCKASFSLLEHHVCSVDAEEPSEPTRINGQLGSLNVAGDSVNKRKSATPFSADGRVEKRARKETEEKESAMSIDTSPRTTPKEVKSPSELQPSLSESAVKKHRLKRVSSVVDHKAEGIYVLRAHAAEVFVASWNPVTPGSLITGSRDATVIYWDIPIAPHDMLPGYPPLPTMKLSLTNNSQADLTSLDWNHDGSLVAIGSYDSVLRICHASGKTHMIDDHHKGPVFAAKFSPSGQWIVTASLDNTSCVWDVKNKTLHRQYRNHEACCLDVDWLDDSTFASGGSDRVIHIVSLSGTKPICTLRGHTGELTMIKCNPSRTRLASCSDDATARIWNLEHVADKASVPVVLMGHTRCLTSVKWCPATVPGAHELVATCSFDLTARLWDSVTGDCLRVFTDHTKYVYSISFSPDGSQLVTGGGDGHLFMYDVKTGEKIWTWSSGVKSGIFEIDWRKWGETSLIALATEHRAVVVIDPTKLSALMQTKRDV